MLKNRVVFFTTDPGYLVPTLVAARQILAQPQVTAMADVLIFLVGFPGDEAERISANMKTPDLRFLLLDPARFTLPSDATFNKTHVPESTLARLVVGEDIPDQYEHVVYLDGDIQIVGPIAPLVLHEVAPGKILAACDHAYINWHERGKSAAFLRRYLGGIGISNPYDYINAGVLAARRSAWIEISALALEFIKQSSDVCFYHDQSALNAVSVGRREVLSPIYNFVSWYQALNAMDYVNPRIIHFTGGSKPWSSQVKPWRGRFVSDYKQICDENPVLEGYRKTAHIKEYRVSISALRISFLSFFRSFARKNTVRRYLKTQIFAR